MTRQKLASLIAKHEGLKTETPIGNIREILKIMVQLENEKGVITDWLSSELNKPTKSKQPEEPE